MTGLELIPIIVASLGTTVFAANVLYLGTWAALAAGAYFGAQALMPQSPRAPKPEDGKFNLKQTVPPLTYVLGRVKKAGDYVFLEEKDGTAYHILCWAGHRIQGFVTHYLHDEAVTLDGNGDVTAPAHFFINGRYVVRILTRLGLNAETAYSSVVSAFPTIWSTSHRGDGLATVCMTCGPVGQEKFMDVYTNQMPEHSAIGDGMRLYDPRTETTAFSKNLALFRLWHLTHPVGGKLTLDDLYIPDWINAANVCDENVTNRDGDTESRYHGGLWFRSNSDPIEVGRLMDQAAELVVYERPDGKVGVHAGEYVAPTVRLTDTDIISAQLDVNTRRSGTVLAVRGRYTNPADGYATNDAAIYGDPYGEVDDSTERTSTLENQVIQSHNHIQRLQKIAYIRKNARRVSILAHYEAAKGVLSSRFVKVHLPPKMTEEIIEITSTPKLSLRDLTISFSGIVVPSTLYDFVAATEEGEPGATVTPIESDGVPTPTGFSATIETEVVAGGQTAAYVYGSWTHVNDALIYEMEYERTDLSTAPVSVFSDEGEDNLRSGYLADGEEYRIRLRAWGGGTSSAWTGYTTLTATADPVAPAALTSFSLAGSAPRLGHAAVSFVTPNDTHVKVVKIYRKASGVALNIGADTPIVSLNVNATSTYAYVDGDATITNTVTNGDMGSSSGWTLGTGVTIGSGVATKASGVAAVEMFRTITSVATAKVVRGKFDITALTAGNVRPRLKQTASGGIQDGTDKNTVGEHLFSLTTTDTRDRFAFRFDIPSELSVDNAIAYEQTASCAPQGAWDYYAVPFNISGVAGPDSGPLAVTII
ncbi:MAG: hypothetical protein H5U22_06390 [Rhizobium sp.]|nr:hypothetical protein [Rhizobium sp.]